MPYHTATPGPGPSTMAMASRRNSQDRSFSAPVPVPRTAASSATTATAVAGSSASRSLTLAPSTRDPRSRHALPVPNPLPNPSSANSALEPLVPLPSLVSTIHQLYAHRDLHLRSRDKLSRAEDHITGLQRQIAHVTHERNGVQSKHNAAQEKLAILTEELVLVNKKLGEAEREVFLTKEEAKRSLDEVSRAKDEALRATKEVRVAQDAERDLFARLNATIDEKDRLSADVQHARIALDEEQSRSRDLEVRLRDTEAVCEGLRNSLNEVLLEKRRTVEDRDRSRTDAASARIELERLKEESSSFSETKDELAKTKAELQVAREEIAKLIDDVKGKQGWINRIASEAAAYSGQPLLSSPTQPQTASPASTIPTPQSSPRLALSSLPRPRSSSTPTIAASRAEHTLRSLVHQPENESRDDVPCGGTTAEIDGDSESQLELQYPPTPVHPADSPSSNSACGFPSPTSAKLAPVLQAVTLPPSPILNPASGGFSRRRECPSDAETPSPKRQKLDYSRSHTLSSDSPTKQLPPHHSLSGRSLAERLSSPPSSEGRSLFSRIALDVPLNER